MMRRIWVQGQTIGDYISNRDPVSGTVYVVLLGVFAMKPFMRTIEVDFDVFKALTMRRSSEEVSENDVLRELLGLPTKRHGISSHGASPAPGDWITKRCAISWRHFYPRRRLIW
jgi:hypothetical protein